MDRNGKKAKASPASLNPERSDVKSSQRTQWGKSTVVARAAAAGARPNGAARETGPDARRSGRTPK